ncbi:hypothetical protein [Fervidobacterium ngatamarikiense]|nr:hypothetical protein [Fervidobacterium pennivorans]
MRRQLERAVENIIDNLKEDGKYEFICSELTAVRRSLSKSSEITI